MKTILVRLDGIQKLPHYHISSFLHKLENNLLVDYEDLLKCEEDFWRTKSRILWLTEGDSNTSFFHSSTINRWRKNRINVLKDEVGNTISEKLDIQSHILSYFKTLFTTNHSNNPNNHFVPTNNHSTPY